MTSDEEQLQHSQEGREQDIPHVSWMKTCIFEPHSISSPLQQKELRSRKVSFVESNIANASQATSIESEGPSEIHKSNHVNGLEQPRITLPAKVVPKTKKKEIEVPLQVRALNFLLCR